MHIFTTLTCPTEYKSTMVKTVIAKRSEKLCDTSHTIHFNLAASKSISIALIQIKAVKNSSNKISVRGKADTYKYDFIAF